MSLNRHICDINLGDYPGATPPPPPLVSCITAYMKQTSWVAAALPRVAYIVILAVWTQIHYRSINDRFLAPRQEGGEILCLERFGSDSERTQHCNGEFGQPPTCLLVGFVTP